MEYKNKFFSPITTTGNESLGGKSDIKEIYQLKLKQ